MKKKNIYDKRIDVSKTASLKIIYCGTKDGKIIAFYFSRIT